MNSYLVEFDPATKQMKIVVDVHQAIGVDKKGFGSQAKIHTRNNVGKSGRIYFGSKQGYPNARERREDYPGGYPMVYDPATGMTKVYPIPVPHEGISSITPDEDLGVAYISTCSDHRPGPQENAPVPRARPARRDLQGPDRYASHLCLHRGRRPAPGLPSDRRRRHPALRSARPEAGASEADDRRRTATGRFAPGRSRGPPDQLGHQPGS